MARARTERSSTSARRAGMLVCRRDEDGTERDERRWVPLETHDKDLARRRMSKVVAMLASGELVADAVKAEASRGESRNGGARGHRRAEGARQRRGRRGDREGKEQGHGRAASAAYSRDSSSRSRWTRSSRRGEARGKTSYAQRVGRAFRKAGQLHHDTPHSAASTFTRWVDGRSCRPWRRAARTSRPPWHRLTMPTAGSTSATSWRRSSTSRSLRCRHWARQAPRVGSPRCLNACVEVS